MYYQHEMQDTFDRLINEQANALTLSLEQLSRVYTSCNEIARWFREEPLGGNCPRIYTQGSIRLQTSITPKWGGGFDADIIVELGPSENWRPTPRDAFDLVGSHLKAMPGFKGQIQWKRRCWALIYDSEYHVDITPAIRDAAKGESAILVFDALSQSWRSSDPLGYAAWFLRRTSLATEDRSVSSLSDDPLVVDPLAGDDWLKADRHIRPLARAIQLLKRRRDLWFDPAVGPNSMVLTTLAANFYRGEETVSESLFNLVQRISEYFSDASQPRIVVNPINDEEVLSENWLNDGAARCSFIAFIAETQALLTKAANTDNEREMATRVEQLFRSN